MRNGSTIAIVFGALMLAASPALAQTATMPEVKTGQTVWVTRQDGTTIKGKVMAIAETGLQLKDGDRLLLVPLADVKQVDTSDSLKNGAIIGAIPTALLFGLGAGTATAYGCLLSEGCSDDANSAAVVGLVVGAGVGALIGAGIDRAIHGRRVLYRAAGSRTAFSVAPVVNLRGAGLRLALQW